MNNSKEWVEHIIEVLFLADNRRLSNIVLDLNKRNGLIKNKNFHGFMHKGLRFIDPRYLAQINQLSKFPLPTLALSLMPDLKQFDLDRERVENDKNRIRQALTPLVINSLELQDLRDSLPDCLASQIPQLKNLPRMRASITTHIQSNAFAMKAYEKALPLIEQYSVASLIY